VNSQGKAMASEEETKTEATEPEAPNSASLLDKLYDGTLGEEAQEEVAEVEEEISEEATDEVADEVEAEVDEAEVDEAEEAEETEAEAEPDLKQQLWDKELQKLQQLTSTLDKKLEDHEANPTKKTEKAVERAQRKVEQFAETLKDSEYASEELTQVTDAITADSKARDEELDALKQQVAAMQAELAATKQTTAVNSLAPEVKTALPDLKKQATEFANKYGSSLGDEAWAALANNKLSELIAGFEAPKKVAKKPAKKKSALTKPVSSGQQKTSKQKTKVTSDDILDALYTKGAEGVEQLKKQTG